MDWIFYAIGFCVHAYVLANGVLFFKFLQDPRYKYGFAKINIGPWPIVAVIICVFFWSWFFFA